MDAISLYQSEYFEINEHIPVWHLKNKHNQGRSFTRDTTCTYLCLEGAPIQLDTEWKRKRVPDITYPDEDVSATDIDWSSSSLGLNSRWSILKLIILVLIDER